MVEVDALLEFTEELLYSRQNEHLSDLQRTILLTSLQDSRMTYDQLAEHCGYSAKYVKQDIAPKLWQLLSQILKQKVTKANVRAMLERELRKLSSANSPLASTSVAPSPLPSITPPLPTEMSKTREDVAPPFKAEPPRQKNSILLVDDQPKNLKLLSDVLEEQGYTIQQAINGTIALQAIAIEPPNLILLDIQMPEMDGYTVCQRLKSDPSTRDIPVIFVSAMDEVWDKVKAFSTGGADYITKPFKVVEVVARVENQLKIQALQRTLKAQNAQLQQAIQELQRLAAIDPITHVASRHRFDDYFQAAWHDGVKAQSPLSLLMVGVDEFNRFNETYGSPTGDQALQWIAQLIKQAAQRPDDLVCRYGGVTFAVILPGVARDQTEAIAHTLLKDFLQDVEPQMHQEKTADDAPGLTLSVGVATAIPALNSDPTQLIDQCDRALRDAREKGGNSLAVGLQ